MFVCFQTFAQEWTKIQERSLTDVVLQVGDRIPFSELHNMINYPTKTFKFSDKKAKLFLLDFWATTCSPCIKFWPTAMRLQQEFSGDLQIITVNSYEDAKRIKSFLTKRKVIDGFEMLLPTACRDSTLWNNFPSGVLPRYVWIDSQGIIQAITNTKDVTSDNIRKWLTSGPLKMDNLHQLKLKYVNPTSPIFVNGNGGEKQDDVFLWSSSLTKGQVDNNSAATIYYNKVDGYGITITNTAIFYLYGHAYNNRIREFDYFDYLPTSRMEIVAKDTLKYYDDGTLGGNTFNYQLISRTPKTRQELVALMQQDLNRFVGLDVKWEKRWKKCLVFTMTDSTIATSRTHLATQIQMRDGKIVIDSVGVKDIMTVMEMGTSYYRDRKYPLIDETHYKGVITGIREDFDSLDPATLDQILSKAGLSLKFEMREVDVLVLRERTP